jgi:tetratricopeptide (TPR) repeat protein
VLRSDDRVRVNAQLIETATGVQLWSERFDREFSDIFAAQDELVRRVVSSISARVGVTERAYAIRKDPHSVNAYDAFLRGSYHWWQFVNAGESKYEWTECRKWFERAAELDPSYARPWAWSAYAAVEGYTRGWGDEEVLESAVEWAKRAVQLDRDDYDAHWSLGFCYQHTRRFDQANSEYRRAYELNPNDPDLIIEMAGNLSFTGKHREAVAQLEKSMSLNPQCADYCRSTLAWALYFVEKYGDSLLQLSQISKLSEDDVMVLAASHARNAQSHSEAGQNVIASEETAAAEGAMRELLQTLPDWTIERERKYRIFKHSSDEEYWLDGLRLAGLPER